MHATASHSSAHRTDALKPSSTHMGRTHTHTDPPVPPGVGGSGVSP